MQQESINRRKRYLYIPPIAQILLGLLLFADESLRTGSTEWLRGNGLTPSLISVVMLIASAVLFIWLARVHTNHVKWFVKVLVAFVLTVPLLLRTFASAYYLWVISVTGSDYTLGVFIFFYLFMWIFFREGLLAGEEELDAADMDAPTSTRR